ncbi:MAG TPA: S9 family peptidase, partial [Thermoanaerobaculia bacterium]|nr:S9 family peptidase [Thermoanaerobaculia bacterium]
VNGGTAGGSVAWNGDASGFYYTRYPREGERPKEDLSFYQQVYFHKLGTQPAEDRYEIGKDFPRIAEISLDTSDDGHFILASVRNGDGGEVEHFVRGEDGRWQQVTHFGDAVSNAAFGFDGNLYLLSTRNAPMGTVIRVPLAQPVLSSAETVIPASTMSIEWFVPTPHHLYASYMAGGPNEL